MVKIKYDINKYSFILGSSRYIRLFCSLNLKDSVKEIDNYNSPNNFRISSFNLVRCTVFLGNDSNIKLNS